MKCKQAEQWIIELSQTGLDPEIKDKLDHHVLHCSSCSRFKENFHWIHQGIPKINTPEPSAELLEKTIALCHDELIAQSEFFGFEKSRPKPAKITPFVRAAFAALLIVSLAWAVLVIREVVKSQTITIQAVLVIIIMIQNLFMLIFSPVLLRTLKLNLYGVNFQF